MIGNAIYKIRVRKTKARTRIRQQQEDKKSEESGRKYKNKTLNMKGRERVKKTYVYTINVCVCMRVRACVWRFDPIPGHSLPLRVIITTLVLFLATLNTHKRETYKPTGGIRTRNPSKRAATDPRLRLRSH
jgi:hypothetical protein